MESAIIHATLARNIILKARLCVGISQLNIVNQPIKYISIISPPPIRWPKISLSCIRKDPSLAFRMHPRALFLPHGKRGGSRQSRCLRLQGTGTKEPGRRKMDFGDQWKPSFFLLWPWSAVSPSKEVTQCEFKSAVRFPPTMLHLTLSLSTFLPPLIYEDQILDT